ncbi:MAG: penicillin acylase family protein [Telluria sp.]
MVSRVRTIAALVTGLTLAALPAHGAQAARTIAVAGLKQDASILVDRWGVPHIYAASEDDLFFAQGFNAARDRLFQIDLWRLRGLGQLASRFGPAYVEQDKAARLFLYRGDMQQEWRAYGIGAEAVTTRFVAGINAYVDYLTRHPEQLPFEFRRLGYLPSKWQAADVVRIRSHGLTRNLTSEVARANTACKAGLAADHIRYGLKPAWVTKIPQGLDPCLPPKLLDVFALATQAAVLDGAMPGTPLAAASTAPEHDASMEGSNNWVIAPQRTTTGRPILANDPHRAYSAPSLRYIAHLSAPGLDVIGAGEPALPGISIGHNGKIAFGLTIFSIDQEDLYVYQTNPADTRQYKYKGGWESMTSVRESIAVRGQAPVSVELHFTRHGPLIFSEPDKERAFAVRTGWMAPGMAPYFGSIGYMRAQDFAQFRHAMKNWGAPTENQVYADTRGNIGWVAGGLVPVRPNWDGLLPVPGDGRYEWAGFLSGDKLPFSYNPKAGWFASANEMNIPASFPYKQHKLGFEWPHNARYVRLQEQLARDGKSGIEDAMRLQNDVYSVPARRLVALLKPLVTMDARGAGALRLLKDWDYQAKGNSAAAALFEVWWSRYLGGAYTHAVLGPQAAASVPTPDASVLIDTLERPAPRFGKDAAARRDQVLLDSLLLAYADMERMQGPDAAKWQWGRLHYLYPMHPLGATGDRALRAKINVGPIPVQGSAYTLNQSSYRNTDFMQINGPSFRVVVDVGNWDNSRAMNMPGQSGDPESPHYRDLAPMWASGAYFPLVYSRAAVEAATALTIKLVPQR